MNEAQRSECRVDRLVGSHPRWVRQTTFYAPDDAQNPNKGNCTEAAVASLLGIPMPTKFGPDGDSLTFWTDFEKCFAAHGFWVLREGGNFQPDGLYLASGPSARGCSHMVVMNGGKLVHDPHPSNAGITEVTNVWLAIPYDPIVAPNNQVERQP